MALAVALETGPNLYSDDASIKSYNQSPRTFLIRADHFQTISRPISYLLSISKPDDRGLVYRSSAAETFRLFAVVYLRHLKLRGQGFPYENPKAGETLVLRAGTENFNRSIFEEISYWETVRHDYEYNIAKPFGTLNLEPCCHCVRFKCSSFARDFHAIFGNISPTSPI